MLYREHSNSLDVHCHMCGADITLGSQNIVDSVILCDECYGDGDDELDLDE